MSDLHVEVNFTPDKVGSTRGLVIVVQGENILHSDRMDIAKSKDRTAFVNKLRQRCPSVDAEEIQQGMLDEAGRASKERPESHSEPSAELDVTRVVPPHLFHVPEASGLLIPVVQLTDKGHVAGKWRLFIHWADDKRGWVDMVEYLDFDNGQRLWFYPRPSMPQASTVPQWSQEGRLAWLGGYTPTADEVFQRLCKQFAHFLEFPREDAIGVTATLSLWTMLTYAYPAWPAVPYLSIGGALGSGKSRVFEVLSRVAYNPIHSSNMTAPCLFRTLDAQGGILLLDEAEKLNDRTPDAREILSILLCGYKKGSRAHRMERVGDTFKSVSFNVYGLKAIAGISGLPPALASRCIRIMMFRAAKNSPVPKRRIGADVQIWADIRDDLHALALANGTTFIDLSQWPPECEGLNGRELEVWQPILAMAGWVDNAGAGGLLGIMKDYALKCVEYSNDDAVPEADEILLRILKEQLRDKPWGITAGELLEKAKDKSLAIFSRYGPRGISAILGRYGIKSDRSGGKRFFRPTTSQWRAVEESYGIDLGPSEDDMINND